MVPHFCGLSPDMAVQLVQAFEHQQMVQAKHEAEMAERAEKDRIEKELSELAAAGGAPPVVVNPFGSGNLFKTSNVFFCRFFFQHSFWFLTAPSSSRSSSNDLFGASQADFKARMDIKASEQARLLAQKAEEERLRREAAQRAYIEEQRRIEEQLRLDKERAAIERARAEAEEQKRLDELRRLEQQAAVDKLKERQFIEEQVRIQRMIEEERVARMRVEDKRRQEEEEMRMQAERLATFKRQEEARKQREYEEQVRKQKEQFEKEKIDAEEEQRKKDAAAAASTAAPAVAPRPTPTPPSRGTLRIPPSVSKNASLDDFDFISVLGRGAFGKVFLYIFFYHDF